MIKAYVLTKCHSYEKVTSITEMMKKVRAVPGVKQAHFVMGPHDGIGYVEVENHEELIKTLDALLQIDGCDSVDTRMCWPQY